MDVPDDVSDPSPDPPIDNDPGVWPGRTEVACAVAIIGGALAGLLAAAVAVGWMSRQ